MISTKEAREIAMEGLRFDFGGSLLSLGRMRYSENDNKYVFSILVSYPRVDYDEGGVDFDDTKMIGEIIINKSTGSLYHTPSSVLNERVSEIKEDGDIEYTSK